MSQSNRPAENAAAYAGLISQIGCTTSLASIIIIAVAFGAGRFLDSYLGTGGVFTVLFLVGSFPVTLYVIIRIGLATAERAQRIMGQNQANDNHDDEEEVDDEEEADA